MNRCGESRAGSISVASVEVVKGKIELKGWDEGKFVGERRQKQVKTLKGSEGKLQLTASH